MQVVRSAFLIELKGSVTEKGHRAGNEDDPGPTSDASL